MEDIWALLETRDTVFTLSSLKYGHNISMFESVVVTAEFIDMQSKHFCTWSWGGFTRGWSHNWIRTLAEYLSPPPPTHPLSGHCGGDRRAISLPLSGLECSFIAGVTSCLCITFPTRKLFRANCTNQQHFEKNTITLQHNLAFKPK